MSTTIPPSTAKRNTSPRGGVASARGRKVTSRRTTITLSPESLEIVERFKSASATSTSAAIDRIIQRSEPKPSRLKENVNGFLVLDVPFRRVNVTLEDVKRAEDEMDLEYVERFMTRKKTAESEGKRTGGRQ
ncbi:MAG: hypothetical protein WCE75_15955 [Terracidiphilus sp.]